MTSYCLISGIKVDIGEIIYTDLVTKLIKDPSKVTKIELTALMIVANNQNDSVSPLPFSGKKKKVKSQTESDNEEMFTAGEKMDEEIPPTNEEVQSTPPNKEQPEPSHVQESDSDSYSLELKKYDNILPFTERQLEAVKEDLALNKKVLEGSEAYIGNSHNLTKLLSLAKTFDLSILKSLVKTIKAALDDHNDHLATWANVSQTTLAIIEGPANVRGENVTQADTEEPLSYNKGENVTMEDDIKKAKSDKAKEEPTRAVPISTVRPICLTNDEINDHSKKEDKIKKAAKEAKMYEMTKTEVIKVFHEEAEKIGLDPKTIISAKAVEKFKKAQDVEHQVLKREHSQKHMHASLQSHFSVALRVLRYLKMLVVMKVASANNVADILTKGLSISQHIEFCKRSRLVDLFKP
uniref:Uncharacterized protein n=1 Tax=Tanacetum cinerariifolium TaxID=118510 RepID=A0A6L2M9H1_TANCI|nr:hypothetical protein [Tanacetum cinerariifolium]